MTLQATAALQNHEWRQAIKLLQQGLQMMMKSQLTQLRPRTSSFSHATKTVLHVVPIPSFPSNDRTDQDHIGIHTLGLYKFAFVVLPSEQRDYENDEINVDKVGGGKLLVTPVDIELCWETAAITAYNLALTFHMVGLYYMKDALLRKAMNLYTVAAEFLNALTSNAGISLPHKWKLLSLAAYHNMKSINSLICPEDSVHDCAKQIDHLLSLNGCDHTLSQLTFLTLPSPAFAGDEHLLSLELLQQHYNFFAITATWFMPNYTNAAAA
jgi:hypothetical protein